MPSNDKDAAIAQLLAQLQEKRERQDALKLTGGWPSWLKGVLIGLSIFIGLGVVHWLMNRRSRELADLKTKQEQAAVALQARTHAAAEEARVVQRTLLFRDVEAERKVQLVLAEQLRKDAETAELRAKKLKEVQTWNDLNKA